MSYVVMNVIDVPSVRREEFEQRFARRAARVADSEGFEAYELMRPGDDDTPYVVYTRWASKQAFEAWVASPAFAEGHRQHAEQGPISSSSRMWSFEVLESEYQD